MKRRLWWAWFLGALTTSAGCGATWVDAGRHVVELSAVAVDTGDTALAIAVRDDCAAAAEVLPPGSPERDAAVDACLARKHYDHAIDAVHQADRALRVAQAALDAADAAHTQSGWLGAAACLVVSVNGVLEALAAANIHLPTDVLTSLTALSAFAGACTPGGTP